MIEPYNAWRSELLDKIELILLDSIDSPLGGLLASEISHMLERKGIETSSTRIALLIKHQGKHIKIERTLNLANEWISLYSINPPLDLNNGDFKMSQNLGYFDPRREIPALGKKEAEE